MIPFDEDDDSALSLEEFASKALDDDAGSFLVSDDELSISSFEDDSIEASSEEEDVSSVADEELSSPQATISAVENKNANSFFMMNKILF
jgi:hypothetical protein